VPDTVELGSRQWIDAITEVLQRTVEGLDLGGRSYTISEEFTSVPSRLVPPGMTSIGWHFRVSDDKVEVFDGCASEADMMTVIDYQACVPLARAVYGDDPTQLAEVKRQRDALVAAGTMRRTGDESAIPAELMLRLLKVHDEMARRTA
jgi:hypothetical protein